MRDCSNFVSVSFNNLFREEKPEDKFIRAVHYFGEHSPATFFTSVEVGLLERDFTRIKNDGFNSVIIGCSLVDRYAE